MTKWETTKCFLNGFSGLFVLMGFLGTITLCGVSGCKVQRDDACTATSRELQLGDVVQHKTFHTVGVITGKCGGSDGFEVRFADYNVHCVWKWEVESAPVKEVTVERSFSNIKEQ